MLFYQYMVDKVILNFMEQDKSHSQWVTIEHPGYLGKQRDQKYEEWNERFGLLNWRIAWSLRDNSVLNYPDLFYKVYMAGYSDYLQKHPKEAEWLAKNASYTYDKDLITKEGAFDPYALYEVPGKDNQFHNVALNIALEHSLGIPFQGENPLQVREGKPGTPIDTWPAGWRWSPGRIPARNPLLIPENDLTGWWQPGSIEDLYQKTKVLQIHWTTHRQIIDNMERSQGYND